MSNILYIYILTVIVSNVTFSNINIVGVGRSQLLILNDAKKSDIDFGGIENLG